MNASLLPAALAALICTGCAAQPDRFADADIVILGEIHDNPEHHRRQAELIEQLQPSAVALEMLSPEQARRANTVRARDARLAEELNWRDSGWPDFALYQPVFEAIGSRPIYGMALPVEAVNRAVIDGAAAVFDDAAAFGLDRPLPASQQAAREAHQQDVHCGLLPRTLLPGMVEAQRLRDAAFAQTALTALRETGGPVVVITGSGHARRDWGMPALIAVAAPRVRVTSVGQFEEEPVPGAPYDVWLVARPTPRPDPCESFKATRRVEPEP